MVLAVAMVAMVVLLLSKRRKPVSSLLLSVHVQVMEVLLAAVPVTPLLPVVFMPVLAVMPVMFIADVFATDIAVVPPFAPWRKNLLWDDPGSILIVALPLKVIVLTM